MQSVTVFLAMLLLTVNLIAAPGEGGPDWWGPEAPDGEGAPPELALLPGGELLPLAFAGKDKPGRAARMHKHVERIQMYRLWKIMEDLNLTDDQVDKFFPLMRELGKKEKELARQRHTLVASMREELNREKPSESRLKQLLADLKRNSSQVVKAKNEAIDRGAKILNIEQQVRMALELIDVERNIWESIARVRHMPSGLNVGEPGLDKQRLRSEMQKLRANLKKISRDLENWGLPGLDAPPPPPPPPGEGPPDADGGPPDPEGDR